MVQVVKTDDVIDAVVAVDLSSGGKVIVGIKPALSEVRNNGNFDPMPLVDFATALDDA